MSPSPIFFPGTKPTGVQACLKLSLSASCIAGGQVVKRTYELNFPRVMNYQLTSLVEPRCCTRCDRTTRSMYRFPSSSASVDPYFCPECYQKVKELVTRVMTSAVRECVEPVMEWRDVIMFPEDDMAF